MQRDLVKEFMEMQEAEKRKASEVASSSANGGKVLLPTAKAPSCQPSIPLEPPSIEVTGDAAIKRQREGICDPHPGVEDILSLEEIVKTHR